MNAEIWTQGLTIDEFVDQMTHCQRAMRRRVETLRLTPFERGLFSGLETPVYALAFTEDWCGDSLMNLPVLAQIARFAPGMDLRIFPRPAWPDLREHLTGREIRSIPVFAFLDETFREIGLWVERPRRANPLVRQWWQARPEAAEIRGRVDLTAEQKREMLRPLTEQFLEEMEGWYDQGLQLETTTEIRKVLSGYLAA
ncbi:MAG TPA: thioredoxin family protein [Anaerolineaceae bacterium]|nr:thioredoxin family protein [Anaerolineaceae bacterium]